MAQSRADPDLILDPYPTHAQAFIQIFMLWFYTYHSVLHGRILPFLPSTQGPCIVVVPFTLLEWYLGSFNF